MKNIKTWAKDDMPREKFLSKGAITLSHSELIALLIGTGTRQKSALELSKELMLQSGNSLHELSRMNIEELMQIEGIGKAKAVVLAAAFEIGRRRTSPEEEKPTIKNSSDIAAHFQALLKDRYSEAFIVAYLNRANRLIKTEWISEGGMTGTVADPRIILKKALDLRAVNMVLCHNHPSGNLQPSRADEELTQKIKNAASLMDIQVLDHIIVSQMGYYSFADEGIL